MPLSSRGSVSARLSVWLSRVSAARKASRSASSTSRPPASCAASAAAPRTTCSDARFLELASVSTSVPEGNSKAASPTLPGGRARRSPVKATGDHQVEDEEELALELEDDA